MNLRSSIFFIATIVIALAIVVHRFPVSVPGKKIPSPSPKVIALPLVTQNNQTDVTEEIFATITNASTNFPQDALTLARKLLDADSADTNGRCGDLLLSLCHAGKFQEALQLADAAPADLRAGWLQTIFSLWAQDKPHDAADALISIPDEQDRSSAFQSLADGWAKKNPADLAAYAAALPDSDDKNFALQKVVDNWSLQDPAAFATWLNTSPPGVDLDQAVAQMISKADGANYPPETAMRWVETISNPALKNDSLQIVLRQWNQNDPPAAQSYLANIPWLDDAQRQNFLASLQAPAIATDE